MVMELQKIIYRKLFKISKNDLNSFRFTYSSMFVVKNRLHTGFCFTFHSCNLSTGKRFISQFAYLNTQLRGNLFPVNFFHGSNKIWDSNLWHKANFFNRSQ